MIIKSIHAKNVLKYEDLILEDLPENGLIAVSGQNESGKSTIGETLCFALFGRTFSLNDEEVEKVVRWGENHCTVTVVFEVEGKAYELSRFLDRDGNHSAKISDAEDSEVVIARGIDAVADEIFNLVGYEFEEFIESFYLAQREITTPHPHSHAVKIMAGVAPLEFAAGEFEQEISDRTDELSDLDDEMQGIEREIISLDMNEDSLVAMQQAHQEFSDQLALDQKLVAMLEDESNGYVQMVPESRAAASSRTLGKVIRFFFFLLAVLTGATWGALEHGMHLPESQRLLELIQTNYPDWQPGYILYLGYAAAGFSVLFLVFWMRVASLNRRTRAFHASADRFADVLAQARGFQMTEPAGAEVQKEESQEQENREEEGGTELELSRSIDEMPVRPDEYEFADIHARIFQIEATAAEVRGYCETELAWLAVMIKQKEQELVDQSRELEDSADRLERVDKLQVVLTDLREKQTYLEARLELRRKAIELLDGASTHQSNNFNRDVKALVGKTLPLFTNNRYEHLQISNDLGVRVFSSEKRDFLDLEEVSSGTQRQIMLALRLALSQKLLGQAVKGKQFTFLDEPFAFFDEERTVDALTALAKFSDEITQIWIVSQSFPAGANVEFAVNLTCSRDVDVLH